MPEAEAPNVGARAKGKGKATPKVAAVPKAKAKATPKVAAVPRAKAKGPKPFVGHESTRNVYQFRTGLKGKGQNKAFYYGGTSGRTQARAFAVAKKYLATYTSK